MRIIHVVAGYPLVERHLKIKRVIPLIGMKNNKEAKNIAGVIMSISIILGFVIGLSRAVFQTVTNRYIFYRLFRLIAFDFQKYLNRYVLFFSIAASIVIVAIFLFFLLTNFVRKSLISKTIIITLKDKNRLAFFLACIIFSLFLFYGAYMISHYCLHYEFYPKRVLGYIGILFFAILLERALIKIRPPILFTFAAYSKITACALITILLLLNLTIWVFSQIYVTKGPNVVLIVIDTLRADHLGSYGYARETSPAIDKLASEGILFLECMSHIPATTPSVASIFTSKHPISHGVLDNNYNGYKLDNQHVTLAELLKENGYNTAAFVSGWTLKRDANLTQGFNKYDDFFDREKKAEFVNKAVFTWLDKHINEKFFLLIHYFDPHGPYEPPSPYNTLFDFTLGEHDITKIHPTQRHGNISDPSYYIAQYDGEILYTDYHINKVLKKLSELNLDNNTLIVLTSDHGETMAEHASWFAHGCFVYSEQIHIPLLLWYPKMFNHKKVDALVGAIDVFPTILNILGINFSKDLEGHSLLPLINDKKEINEFIYCESGRGDPQRNKGGLLGLEGKQFAVQSKEWKLIRVIKTSGVYYELYNLSRDPKEIDNLIGRGLPIENYLMERLDKYVKEYKASAYYQKGLGKALHKNLDKDVIEKIKSLGYL